tara:strand:- start:978 stop:2057 length:1080 start_codon:yes stop_codon:yes gene_type:complete
MIVFKTYYLSFRYYFIIIFFYFFVLIPVRSQDLFDFNHNGINRQYYLYVPESLPVGAPLVFVFHGYGGNALSIMNYSDMNNMALEHHFAVCYPQGTSDSYGEQFWNVGYEFHSNETVDDIGFILELSQFLKLQYNVSHNNIFSTGMSNGGDFSYLLACEASNIFQAISPVAGTMMTWIYDSCQPIEPLSVFEIHGTDDSITLWEGDIDNSEGWGSYMDIASIIDFWKRENDCQLLLIDTLENSNTSDGSFIISETYEDCSYDNQVKLYKIINGGHDWPGAFGNMDINSNEEIWEFFEYNMQMEIIGDVNFDSLINIQDLLYISDYVINNNTFYFLYDFDNNADLNSNDIVSIIDYILEY